MEAAFTLFSPNWHFYEHNGGKSTFMIILTMGKEDERVDYPEITQGVSGDYQWQSNLCLQVYFHFSFIVVNIQLH